MGARLRPGCGAEGLQEGQYGGHIAEKHPDWAPILIGEKLSRPALLISREYGVDTKGGKVNSRMWVEDQREQSRAQWWILGIERSKHAVAMREGCSDEARSREFIWNIRDPNGGEPRAAGARARTKNRGDRKPMVVRNLEYNGPYDRWGK